MLIYLYIQIVNIILTLLCFVSKNKKVIYYCNFIFMLYFLGFAYLNGSDWISYQKVYENIFIMSKEFYFEIGFKYYMLFIHQLGLNFEWFRFFSTSIDLIIIYSAAKRDTKYYMLFIALYTIECLYYLEIDGPMRQAKAIIICIFAMKYIYNKKIVKFYIFVILAIIFHKTAVLFLPMYFIRRINLNFFRLIFILFMVHIFQKNYLIPILKLFAILTGKSFSYFNSIYSLPQNNNIYLEVGRQIIYLLPIYIVDKNYIFFKNKIKNLKIIYNFACIFIIILNISLYFNIVARTYLYFSYNIYILYTYLFYQKKKIRNILIFIVVISTLNLKSYLALKRWESIDKYRYIPYTNYILEYIKGNNLLYEKKVIRRLNESRINFRN